LPGNLHKLAKNCTLGWQQHGDVVNLPAGRQDWQNIMYYVYVLKSRSREYLYVGLTDNIERRFNQHQRGHEKTTKPYRPYILLHTESFLTRQEARNREKYLKSGIGKEWLKNHYK